MVVIKTVGLKFVCSEHVQRRIAVNLMLVLVVVRLQLVRRQQVCFVRHQQTLACMHHVNTKTATLKIHTLVIVDQVSVMKRPDFFVISWLVNVPRVFTKDYPNFVFLIPQAAAMASGAK